MENHPKSMQRQPPFEEMMMNNCNIETRFIQKILPMLERYRAFINKFVFNCNCRYNLDHHGEYNQLEREYKLFMSDHILQNSLTTILMDNNNHQHRFNSHNPILPQRQQQEHIQPTNHFTTLDHFNKQQSQSFVPMLNADMASGEHLESRNPSSAVTTAKLNHMNELNLVSSTPNNGTQIINMNDLLKASSLTNHLNHSHQFNFNNDNEDFSNSSTTSSLRLTTNITENPSTINPQAEKTTLSRELNPKSLPQITGHQSQNQEFQFQPNSTEAATSNYGNRSVQENSTMKIIDQQQQLMMQPSNISNVSTIQQFINNNNDHDENLNDKSNQAMTVIKNSKNQQQSTQPGTFLLPSSSAIPMNSNDNPPSESSQPVISKNQHMGAVHKRKSKLLSSTNLFNYENNQQPSQTTAQTNLIVNGVRNSPSSSILASNRYIDNIGNFFMNNIDDNSVGQSTTLNHHQQTIIQEGKQTNTVNPNDVDKHQQYNLMVADEEIALVNRNNTCSKTSNVDGNNNANNRIFETLIFSCEFPNCNYNTTLKSNWISHLRKSHKVSRPFKCAHFGCAAAFKDKYRLRVHNVVHTGEKPFGCNWPGCEARFTQSGHLSRHRKKHTFTPLFHCTWPDCTRTFTQKHSLKYHLMSHSGDKPWRCQIDDCDRSFVQRWKLVEHQQKRHHIIVHHYHPKNQQNSSLVDDGSTNNSGNDRKNKVVKIENGNQ